MKFSYVVITFLGLVGVVYGGNLRHEDCSDCVEDPRFLQMVGPPRDERDRVVKEARDLPHPTGRRLQIMGEERRQRIKEEGMRVLRSFPKPLEEDPDSEDPLGNGRVLKESNIVEKRDLKNSPSKGEKYHLSKYHN